MISPCYVRDIDVRKREDGLWYAALNVMLYYFLSQERTYKRVLTLVIMNQSEKRQNAKG